MGIKIGGIDLASAVINNEHRIAVLEKIVERLSQHAPPGAIDQDDIERFRREALEELQEKYPDAGIELNN